MNAQTYFLMTVITSMVLNAEASMKLCPDCGEELLDSDKCCPYCVPIVLPETIPSPKQPVQSLSQGYSRLGRHWTPIKVGLGGTASLPSIRNANVGGLDLEFGAMGDTLCGIGLGWVGGFREIYGVQCSVIGNFEQKSTVCGLQIAGLIGNFAHSVYGIQIGGSVNITEQDIYGIQISAIGNAARRMHGLQIGFYNGDKSVDMCGVQIGVINTAERMSGIQIGLFNFIDNSPISFFPVVNMCF